ncbi:MAG: kelch repeat-containing protein [Myxococcales bacterium]|nr:kelch repeat-containing protein [Myxococcales bacterium]
MFHRAIAVSLLVACSAPVTTDAPASAWQLALGGHAPLPVGRLEPGVTALGDQLVIVGGFDFAAGFDTRVDVFDTLCTADPPTLCWNAHPLPPAPVARTHIQLAGIGQTLYLLGGLEGPQFIARGDSYKLDTLVTPLVWQPIASMPAGLERGSAAIVISPPRIYLFGGASTTAALASNIFYDIELNAWCPGAACPPSEQLPDLPEPRSHPAAMRRIDGSFVVVGGLATLFADSARDNVWILTPTTTNPLMWNPWQISTHPMPTPRGGCAYGVLQGRLVCAGGEAGTSALAVTEAYDPNIDVPNSATSPWTTLEPIPSPRAGTQGAAIGQRLFVPGGAAALAFEPLDTLWVFSPLDVAPR